jgi:hypothetical protein
MIGAREELLNGVVLHQATDEPADKCNIYCEYPWCPPDSHCFVYVRHAPDHAPNTSAYIACDFGSWEKRLVGYGSGGRTMADRGKFYYKRVNDAGRQEFVRCDLESEETAIIARAFGRPRKRPDLRHQPRTRDADSGWGAGKTLSAAEARDHQARASAHKARGKFLEDALERRIDQVRIAPGESSAQIVFVKDGKLSEVAELDLETFEYLRDHVLFKEADGDGHLHARSGDQIFILNASTQGDELVLNIRTTLSH